MASLVLLLLFALACVGGGTQQVQESVNKTKTDYENWLRTIGSLPAHTVGIPLIIEPEDGSAFDSDDLVVKGWSVKASDKSEDPDAIARVRVYVMPDGYRTASAATARPYSEGTALVDEETGEWELALPASVLYRGVSSIAARTEIDGVGSSGLARITVTARTGRTPGEVPGTGVPDHDYAADSGFRPSLDGYAFRNGSDTDQSDDWRVWKYVFGGSLLSRLDYSIVASGSGLFEGGMCSGFASSASTVWYGANDAAGFPGSPATVFGVRVSHDGRESGLMQPQVVREFIQRYQLTQRLNGYHRRVGTEATFRHLKGVFESGDRDIPVLVIRSAPGGAGHAITPFAIAGPADGEAVIWVWDNNHPGQARPVYIDTTAWSWRYDLVRDGEFEGVAARTWSSAEGGPLRYVPTSDIVDLMNDTPGGASIVPEERPSLVQRLLAPFTSVSITAEPLLENESGERFGFADGEVYEEIDDVEFFYPDIWAEPVARVFFHPEGADYRRTAALAEEGGYSYAVSDEAGIVVAQVFGEAGSDTLGVDADSGVLEYAAGADRDDVDLTLYRPVGESVRTMGTEDTALVAGDVFSIAASEGDEGMVVVNASAGERTYVPVFAVDDGALFVAGEQMIGSGETHTIVADDWDDLPTAGVTLAVDRDSDGEVDEVVSLQEGVGSGGDRGIPFSGLGAAVQFTALLVGAALLVLAGVAVLLWPRRRRGED